MIKKKIAMLFVTVMLMVSVCACAENQIPDMTKEEMQQIGEYVGVTLMKYDAAHRSRLVELKDEPINPQTTPIPTAEPEQGGMDPVEDTPVIDNTGGSNVTATSYTIEEVLRLEEGLRLVFKGQEVCEYYPKDTGSNYFSINAAEGKKLLVLNFILSNTSDKSINVDMLSSDVKFRIAVNGDYSRRVLTTVLENDMSTYVGSLASGDNKEVVLLIEVTDDKANAITAVDLKVQNDTMSCTIKVF